MFVDIICWFLVLLIRGASVDTLSPSCDSSHNVVQEEGTIGQTKMFSWLGVLKVHLHQETSLKIALTGIVYIKHGYAIGNADDVARIPKRVFKEDSQAMFIPSDDTPWYCKLVDYMTHPDYEFETMSSVALLELDPGERKFFPMKPICWPTKSYNASNELYAVGFTDENQLLEKFIFKLQFVEQNLCKEFYNRAGLTEGKMAPTHYQCGFAKNNNDNCVWDNGMALVANTSGYWMLLGLGLHGPGCAAPSRFIDLVYYYPWIESATNIEEIDDYTLYRKSAFNDGFRKSDQNTEVKFIPAHELLGTRRGAGGRNDSAHYYPFDGPINADNLFHVQRIDGSEIHINSYSHINETTVSFPGHEAATLQHLDLYDTPEYNKYKLSIYSANQWLPLLKRAMPKEDKEIVFRKYYIPYNYMSGQIGRCGDPANSLVYKDYITVHEAVSPSLFRNTKKTSTGRYKVSLYDLYFLNYTCVTIKVHSSNAEDAYLYYSTVIEESNLFAQTPAEIVRIYPYQQSSRPNTMIPSSIKTSGENITVHNMNLYLKFDFVEKGRLEIKVFGPNPSRMAPKQKGHNSLRSQRRPTKNWRNQMRPTENKHLQMEKSNKSLDIDADNTLLRNRPQEITTSTSDVKAYKIKNDAVDDVEINVGTRPGVAMFGLFLLLIFL